MFILYDQIKRTVKHVFHVFVNCLLCKEVGGCTQNRQYYEIVSHFYTYRILIISMIIRVLMNIVL